jgi:hypothetical protein
LAVEVKIGKNFRFIVPGFEAREPGTENQEPYPATFFFLTPFSQSNHPGLRIPDFINAQINKIPKAPIAMEISGLPPS